MDTTTPRKKVLRTPKDWDEWLLAAHDYAIDHITTLFSICYMRQWIFGQQCQSAVSSVSGLEFPHSKILEER
jgi:hypothetical protein